MNETNWTVLTVDRWNGEHSEIRTNSPRKEFSNLFVIQNRTGVWVTNSFPLGPDQRFVALYIYSGQLDPKAFKAIEDYYREKYLPKERVLTGMWAFCFVLLALAVMFSSFASLFQRRLERAWKEFFSRRRPPASD